MGKRSVFIPAKELKNLYLKEGLTSLDLARKFNCSDVTVRNKLRQLKIKLYPGGRRKFKYEKSPFDGSNLIKAYMLGFRIGDLNVYQPSPKSKILVVRCHTTIKEQIDVIRVLFEKFGAVKISESEKHSFHVNCYLDHSFDFLLDKKSIPLWVKNNIQNSWAFIAGYVDAEGSFKLNQGRGRFKIDSYDYFVLEWMKKFLQDHKINAKFRRISEKGKLSYCNGIWKNDLWRININEANSLEKFIYSIHNFLIHKIRIRDAKETLNNIKIRRKHGTIK